MTKIIIALKDQNNPLALFNAVQQGDVAPNRQSHHVLHRSGNQWFSSVWVPGGKKELYSAEFCTIIIYRVSVYRHLFILFLNFNI